MLAKLLKYEIPALGRKLVPLYIAWAATAIVLGFALSSGNGSSEGFGVVVSILLYTAVATAVGVMAVILIVQRYSNSLLGDEAYFNQVLPVSVSAHIGNKLISAIIWVAVTGLVAILTGIIIGVLLMLMDGTNSYDMLDFSGFRITGRDVLVLFEGILIIIASITKTVMQIYAAITIGHQAAQRTTLASIGAYIGILIFESIIARAAIAIGTKAFMASNLNSLNGLEEFHMIVWPALIFTALLSAVYFFICKYLMEKRLNLA